MPAFENNAGAWIILALTVIASLAGFANPSILEKCVLRPYQVARGSNRDTLYLSGFVHADTAHLFFNLFTFYFFAFPLERRLGTLAFVVGYVLSLIGSSLPSVVRHRDDPDYASLGASGGVTAVLFAYIILYPSHHLYLFLLPFPIPALAYALCYVAYSVYSSRHRSGDRINHDAHLGGVVCAMIWVGLCVPDAYASLRSQLVGIGDWLR